MNFRKQNIDKNTAVSKRVGLGLMKINKKRFLIKLDGTFFIKTYYNNLKHYKRLFSMKS